MVKVLYDINGNIVDYWAVTDIPESPYIEITEQQHCEIINKGCYKVIDASLTDISSTEAYQKEQASIEKKQHDKIVKEQILYLEQSQNRAVREFILTGSEDIKQKLLEIESNIANLRSSL